MVTGVAGVNGPSVLRHVVVVWSDGPGHVTTLYQPMVVNHVQAMHMKQLNVKWHLVQVRMTIIITIVYLYLSYRFHFKRNCVIIINDFYLDKHIFCNPQSMVNSLIGQLGAHVQWHVVTVARLGPGNATHPRQLTVVNSAQEQTKSTRTVKKIFVQVTSVTGLAGLCVVLLVVMVAGVNGTVLVRVVRVVTVLREKLKDANRCHVHVSCEMMLHFPIIFKESGFSNFSNNNHVLFSFRLFTHSWPCLPSWRFW